MTLAEEPQQFGSDIAVDDEAPSNALMPAAVPTVLLFCSLGPDLDEVCAAMLKAGLRPVHIPRQELLPPAASAPLHCLIELRLPGAEPYLSELANHNDNCQPVAVLASSESEARAYELGAHATLKRPLDSKLVSAVVTAQLKRVERQRQSEVMVQHGHRVSTANALEGLLRAVGQDLRNPLAAALANMEFLAELPSDLPSPVTENEHHAIVQDTLASLQQLRSVLEQVTALVPRDPPELRPLHLWAIAQQVIDDLPTGAAKVTLSGDAAVYGWGDEVTLAEVTTTLVRRALEQGMIEGQPKVTIHVYAHDTEARLTVHDKSVPSGDSPLRDPFHPGLTLRKTGQSGLMLTAARHAIVRMGGALNYVPRTKSGYAFRVRLRVAQPD